MEAAALNETTQPSVPIVPAEAEVTLADGSTRTLQELRSLGKTELLRLQFEQEQAFARRILEARKGSPDRAKATRQAYDTVTRIHATVVGTLDRPPVMGLHPRYERLIGKLLDRQAAKGIEPSFFEIGYAGGVLLKQVSQRGVPVAGIEVSQEMHRGACRLLGPGLSERLHLGSLLDFDPPGGGRYSLIYWNDVFEHVPPDEILDYLHKAYRLLVPGGQLVTITPNWHRRPSDVTADLCPPRTEARGLHLKEYTLREVTRMLRSAGFRRAATPLVVVPRGVVLCGGGLAGPKRALEPCLEWLPFRAAELLCRGLGLSQTIAAKAYKPRKVRARDRRRKPVRGDLPTTPPAVAEPCQPRTSNSV